MGTPVKRTHRASRRIAAGLGLVAAAFGLAGLAGWLLDAPVLISIARGHSGMKANAALGFVGAGLALFAFAALPRASRLGLALRRGGAGLAGLLGLATIVQHLAGVDLGIDQLIVADLTTTPDLAPGRMPRAAAVGFLLYGIATLLLPRPPAWAFWSGFAVAALGFWAALFVGVAFLFDADSLYVFASFARASPYSAAAFLSLFAGVMFAVPDRGWARIVLTDKFGGYVARRLLPLMAVLPLLILWLAQKGGELGLYPERLSQYAAAVALLIVLTTVVLVMCGRLNVLDAHRRTIAEGRQRAHAAALRLREIAEKDALTGLSNRRRFLAVAEERIEAAHAVATPVSLLMVDIDYFKRINDTHGHAAGDHALRLLGATLAESTRKADCVARLGGEEFAILLAGVTPAVALAIAERICEQVTKLAVIDGEGRRFGFSVSIGLASLAPDDRKPEDLLARADAALYRAKRAGRNRVETAEPVERHAA